MILPSTEKIIWESPDAQKLKDFLNSETGQRVLNALSYCLPLLLDGSDNGKTLVASGRRDGYTLAVQTLIDLTKYQPPQEPEKSDYPPLEDDAAWDDGLTTTEPPTEN